MNKGHHMSSALRSPPGSTPVKRAREAAMRTDLVGIAGAPRRRALVVAADTLTQRMCRTALETSGLAVYGVDSGMAALMSAREFPPSLIVVDQQLRDVSGNEAIGWLRANSALRTTPIIALTTNAGGDDTVAAAAPAAALRKPLSPLAIRRAIRAALA
jgi:two-component system phosphate regulon response regulator PhoB